jgi:hypothetical protein
VSDGRSAHGPTSRSKLQHDFGPNARTLNAGGSKSLYGEALEACGEGRGYDEDEDEAAVVIEGLSSDWLSLIGTRIHISNVQG